MSSRRGSENPGPQLWQQVTDEPTKLALQELSDQVPAAIDTAVATTLVQVTTTLGNARGVFSVKDFGAKGDWNGSSGTDDTAAIQAALTALLAAAATVPGYSTLYFPAGQYKTTAAITGAITGGLCIRGEAAGGGSLGTLGRGSGLHCSGSHNLFTFTAGTEQGAWEMVGLAFTGGFTSAVALAAIQDGYIHGCSFGDQAGGGTTGVAMTSSCAGMKLVACHFDNIATGVSDSGGTGLMVTACDFKTGFGTACITLASSISPIIAGNYFPGATTMGVKATAASFPAITGNTFDGTGVGGTAIQVNQAGGTKANATIAGNTIRAATTGVDIQGGENCNVSHNVIDAVTALNFAQNGAHTCAGTYYDGNIAVAYNAGVHGQITVGAGATPTAGVNINGV